MIFEGTWTDGIWTSTDTIDEIYAAYEAGKIPVLHIPDFEYEDTDVTVTDEAYTTLYNILSMTATVDGQTSTLYEFHPDTVYIAGLERNLEIDETRHLVVSTK